MLTRFAFSTLRRSISFSRSESSAGADRGPDPLARPALVHEVDGLVGQEPLGDVPARERGRRLEGAVGVAHLVVGLVVLLDALQDRHGLLDRRLLDHDGLEPALERRIALDVLLVLVQRRRADALQLAAREGRLQHVRGVDGALGPAGADDRVQLVDEQHDVARREDLLHDPLEALLELAPVLRARDERSEVEHEHPAADEHLGHRALDDLLGQALDDGGLADARFADQHGVVLGPAGEDLDDPLDLLLPADHGVELPLPGERREVAAELVERRGGLARGGRRLLAGGARLPGAVRAGFSPAADGEDRLAQHVRGHVVLREVARDHRTLLLRRGEQQVLGADVLVAHAPGLLGGVLEDLLPALRRRHVAEDEAALALGQAALDLGLHLLEGDLDPLQGLHGHALPVAEQREDDVLRAAAGRSGSAWPLPGRGW